MTGIPNFNAGAFNTAERKLHDKGHTPINPIALDVAAGDVYETEHLSGVWVSKNRTNYLRRDIAMLADANAGIHGIYMLQGWEKSKGARLEKEVAEGLGLWVYYEGKHARVPEVLPLGPPISSMDAHMDAPTFKNGLLKPADSILDRAKSLVHGERGADYGHPLDDFTRTAGAASSLGFRFQPPGAEVRELKAEDIPILMMCVKLSREINRPGPQNLEDIAGYAECKHMVAQERGRRAEF